MRTIRSATPFDLFIWLLVFISYASISLLILNTFKPVAAIIMGAIAAAILALFLRVKLDFQLRNIPYELIVILFISLIFRCQPYLYVPGGQDQGTYVNMSAVYERDGSTFVIDKVREKAVASGLADWYDKANQQSIRVRKINEYEGGHLLGIYIKDLSNSEYVFQFYPLHPLWMAIAGKCAGTENRVYSLVLFSLLSIVSIYLLARELSGGSRVAGAVSALLLSVNPLHAFFSKFPVTEVVALAFSSLALLYLARYYNSILNQRNNIFYLVLSAMLFGCLFLTRISGFIYLPFFYFLSFLIILFCKETPAPRNLAVYLISITVLYAASVTYGMTYSYPYSHDVYKIYFSRFFHSSWQTKVIFLSISALLSLAILWFFRNALSKCCEGKLFRFLENNFVKLCTIMLIVVIAIAFYKAYLLAFTNQYIGTRWDFAGIGAGARFSIAGLGFKSLTYSNIFVAIWYLSPVGFLFFLYALFRFFPKKRTLAWTSFLGFLTLAWLFFTIIKFYTQFQYYYARYLSSELVPYTLLGIGLALGYLFHKGKWSRSVSITLTAIITAYFLFFTCYQFKGRAAEGAYVSFDRIAQVVGKSDLLFLYDLRMPHRVVSQTTLGYFYGINVCNLREPSVLSSKEGKSFLSHFKRIFLLSQKPLDVPFLKLVNKIEYRQGDFEEANFIPMKFEMRESTVYLYGVTS